MLSEYRIHAAIPVEDLERAREFYGDALGIPSVRDDDHGTNYSCRDSIFRIYATSSEEKSDSTRAAFTIDDDLEKLVKELQKKGVPFLEYDTPISRPRTGSPKSEG